MTKVFISGSMRIKNLNTQVLFRLEHLIQSNFEIIVGDADGVDSAIQIFFADKSYPNVTVYCSGEQPRNNIGSWPVKHVESSAPAGTRAFFTAKDMEMANECDFGLMIWDAKSTGTLSNTMELLKQGKKSRVFINKEKAFVRIVDVEDFESMIGFMSEVSFRKADEKLKLTSFISQHRQGSFKFT